MLVGVDIGGTFTDLVINDAGTLRIHKLLSTPATPAQAMLHGLAHITPGGLSALTQVAHGSTVATNAILERKGAHTALITTQGFRDLLFIGRQHRPELYALHPQLPPPLIPREHCYEVPERLDHTGAVLKPLDLVALDSILEHIRLHHIESVAICLLYSYRNPQHEQHIRDRMLEQGIWQPWQIALSSQVLPEFREYERASTVALDAYVRPVMSRYLTQLEEQLPPTVSLRIMKSDGGVMTADRTRQQAVQTALSGPAAGVIGAFHLAQQAGFDQLITMDIGGTSTDVALCPGEPIRRPESTVDGLPLRIRLLDIETIGAGGGSIARLDAGGALRVGPESAGSLPGPISYGRGGTQITVSDANAVLGRLDPAHFLGGSMTLDVESARRAVADLAAHMDTSVESAAEGILQIATVNIDRAIRRVSVARGYDPRGFTLVAFGGAGPLHACAVAERLEMSRIFIPRYPGVLCALGLLVADLTVEYSQAVLQPAALTLITHLRTTLQSLLARAQADLQREGIPQSHMRFLPQLDLRYHGQAFELSVPFTADSDPVAAFHQAHERAYGHALPDRPVEVVNLRLQAIGLIEKPTLAPEPPSNGSSIPEPAIRGQRGDMTLYDRESLPPGTTLTGPALLFQFDSTVYIAPAWRATVDSYRNLVLTRL
jgi:N-methylhydantoinase A